MLIRYMCTACAWEASGAVSGKFREISAPAAPLANFSLNFAKLWDTPSTRHMDTLPDFNKTVCAMLEVASLLACLILRKRAPG